MNLALIGCGVIGERRLEALPKAFKVAALCDRDLSRAQKLKSKFEFAAQAQCFSDVDKMLSEIKCEAAIVATINASLFDVTQTALSSGLHVLVEKPAARSINELRNLKNPLNKLIKVGFNHRFHPAFIDIQKEIFARPNDPIMYIRASYGNGARVGFEKEWRADPKLAGGGELLDQGVHVLDLASVLLGPMQVLDGLVRTHFWQMPVDDNAWAWLSTPRGQTFSMHVSSSEWKNEFRFEVYTKERKYQWTGLGRSYGTETLNIFKMKPEMGPPDIELREYSGPDLSWQLENQNFAEAIEGKSPLNGDVGDAQNSLSLVAGIYEKARAHSSPTQSKYLGEL